MKYFIKRSEIKSEIKNVSLWNRIQDIDLKYWLAFSKILQLGPIRLRRIYNHFPSMEEAWDAPAQELHNAGLDKNIVDKIIEQKKNIDPTWELDNLHRQKIQAVTIQDESYPSLLKEIYNPPPLIYYTGNLKICHDFCLAVVGTRKVSSYGKQIIDQIVGPLANKGITIVSGLALGVDSLAHQITLENQGSTIAVLGSSLDHIYPQANYALSQKILEQQGLLISEYPLGTRPAKQNFPFRNRIISGLSLGTLIIEAPESSGALITAKFSLEQNREVFAVPGDITKINSSGTNALIKQGAKPVTSPEDILDALNLDQIKNFLHTQEILPDNPQEEKMLAFINRQPIHINKLIELTHLPANQVNATLLTMEMKGKIKNLGGQNYVISH
ncbi:MAG: DNA-processing protein DprA [Patescibacteria group bacterium]|nr:DNA-processing protein DprA [Patescibacteria group bacterium]